MHLAPHRARPSRLSLGLARWSATHPWRAVGAWLLLIAAAVVLSGAVGTREASQADYAVGEAGRADLTISAHDFGDRPTENVLITARQGALTSDQLGAAVADVRSRFAALPEVAGVGEPVPAPGGAAVMVPVTMAVSDTSSADAMSAEALAAVPALQRVTGQVQAAHPQLRVEQIGDASINASVGDQIGRDFRRAELLSVPVTLLILALAFGALFAAGVPVLLALTAVAGAVGLAALTSHLAPSTEELNSVILLIGMAVGVDYSLFYIRRAREERARGASVAGSIDIAARTSGHAVVVSGVTVMIAMAGMFIAGDTTFTSFAIGTILVVAVAVLGSLTVLPAVLVKLGDHVDRPRIPLVHRLTRRADAGSGGRFWPAALRVVLAKPALSFGLAMLALAALAAPALGMRTAQSGPEDLPRSMPIMQAYDRLTAAFPAQGVADRVVISRTDGGRLDRASVDAASAALIARAAASPAFRLQETGGPAYSLDGAVARLDLPLAGGAETEAAREALATLRHTLLPAAFGGLDGVRVDVTGMTAQTVDFGDRLAARLPWVVGFVLALTFVVLLVTFRSVVIAGTAIVLNLLSVAAAYGLLVLVFQHGVGQGLLGFHSNGAVITWLPMFLFVILFGLSMDYHVFVVSRIREAAAAGVPTKDAVRHGITASAGVVTSAAVIMVGVFSIFGTLSLLEFKQLGVGLAAAVLLDATVVRAVLLPSAMALLGERNWYLPAWLGWLPGRAPVAAAAPEIELSAERELAGVR